MNDGILKPGVSVVVCCFNSAEVIVPTIRSVAGQAIPPGTGYEVILVDNNCTDDTMRLAKGAWAGTGHPLRIVKETEPGLIHARKAGVAAANYHILLFIDDDNILAPDWIGRLPGLYSRRPDVGGIGGYIEPLLEGEKPAWFDKFSGMYACTPAHENPDVSTCKQTLFGAGLSLRTEAARQVFASDLPFFLVGRTRDTLNRGDDSEICLRIGLLGWKLWYENSLKLKHAILKQRINWGYVLRARRGGGHADLILKIYQDLLAGATPLTHAELAAHISSLWQEFWQWRSQYRDLAAVSKEGTNPSLKYHYLQGLTEGFLLMDKHEYETIRKRISDFYAKRKTD